jgi:hypothetical protein
MFITKKKLEQMIEKAKLKAISEQQEKFYLQNELNEIHKYICRLEERVCDLERVKVKNTSKK